MAILSGQNF